MDSPVIETFLRAGAIVLLLAATVRALLSAWRAFRGSSLHRLLADGLLVAALALTLLSSVEAPPSAEVVAGPSPTPPTIDVDHLALLVLPMAVWVWAYYLLPRSICEGWLPQRIAIERVANAGSRLRRRQSRGGGGQRTFVAVLELTGSCRGGYWPYNLIWSDSPFPDGASMVYVDRGRARLKPGMVCIAELDHTMPYRGCRRMAGRPVAVLEPRTWNLGSCGFNP